MSEAIAENRSKLNIKKILLLIISLTGLIAIITVIVIFSFNTETGG
jgi:hypothetical protein